MPELKQILLLAAATADAATIKAAALRHRARRVLVADREARDLPISIPVIRLDDPGPEAILAALGPGPNLVLLPVARHATLLAAARAAGLFITTITG